MFRLKMAENEKYSMKNFTISKEYFLRSGFLNIKFFATILKEFTSILGKRFTSVTDKTTVNHLFL